MWKNKIEELGFAIIPSVLISGEIESLLASLENSQLPRSKAGIRHLLCDKAAARLAKDGRLMEIAREILGLGATPFHATLFDKSSNANWLVAWHQDTALPLLEQSDRTGWGPWSVKQGVHYAHAPASALEKVVALRVHLDDSCADNGPLRVLPDTHQLGVLSDDSIEELCSRIPATACLVPKGGVLVMRPLVVHASSKSQINAPRRVLHIEYAASMDVAEGMRLATA